MFGGIHKLSRKRYGGRRMRLAIRGKSMSNVKSVAPYSEAIAAIRASVVVTATPFVRAARKMLAASRYVENPFGFEDFPLRKILLDATYATIEPLQEFPRRQSR